MRQLLNNATLYAVTAVRLGWGATYAGNERVAAQRLILYDFEACPFCRKVREALSHLGLEVEVRPVARGSTRRAELRQLGGKVRVPYLLDPNTGVALYESEQIVRYLYRHYGSGRLPLLYRLGPLNTALSFAATALRPTRGRRVLTPPRHRPAALPVLYNLESSPQCRKVREVLTELDLPYICKNVLPGSAVHEELRAAGSTRRVPVFIDGHTGSTLADGDAIVEYLHRTYAAG